MTWATPALAAIVAACLIPPLILLYFLKLRRREQIIPSTLLWKQSVQDMQANAPFQRLRMNLLLFLQLLALLLLVLAIAQPEWEGEGAAAAKTILLIDRSASMTATDVDGSRLERAKADAIEFIDGLRAGGVFSASGQAQEVMIIGFANEAQVYSSFSSSKAQLAEAIRSIEPTHGTTRIEEALELARAHTISTDPEAAGLEIKAPVSILLFSDGRIHDLEDQVAKEMVQYRRIGDENTDGNVGLVAFDARRTYVDQNTIDLYARIANWGSEPVSTTVFLSAGDQLLRSTPVTIPPGYPAAPNAADAGGAIANADEPDDESNASENDVDDGDGVAPHEPRWRPGMTEVRFTLLQEPDGLTLGVNLEIDDDLIADNRAYVIVPPAKQLRVGLVSPPDSFPLIQTVLEGLPNVARIELLTVERYTELASTTATDEYDLIILNDVEVERLGPGRYMTFGPLPPIEGLSASETAGRDTVIAAADDHPVNQYVNYNTLIIGDFFPITAAPEIAQTVIEGANGPLMIEIVQGPVRALITPVSPLNTNWIVDPNFVPLMQNAVEYLGAVGEALTESSLRPGDAITARLPAGATNIRLFTPASGDSPIELAPADPSRTSWGPVRLAGLYTLIWNEPGASEDARRDFAVNLYDEDEGHIAPAANVQFGREQVDVIAAEERLRKRPLWPWAILLALFFVLVEWLVYSRRSYI